MNNQVKSAARVLDVLEFLSAQTEPVRLNELVVRLGFPKSSAYGLLSTLVARGYVKKDSADRYSIVEALRQGFGWVGGFEGFLVSVATPIVEELRDRVDETVFVCVRSDNQDARLMIKRVSTQPIRYDSADHAFFLGYATVMGRVLLAFQPADVIDAYLDSVEIKAFTAISLPTKAEILAALEKIRRDGYGTIIDEYAAGGAGIAAPIRNADGRVVAVINIATVTPRYEAQRDQMRAAVLEGAERISSRLGYRQTPDQTDNTPQGDA